jgi:hypothetical protein
MAQLVALIVSQDEDFKKQLNRTLRSGTIPVSVSDERLTRDIAAIDIVIVDVRGETSSSMAAIERLPRIRI